MNRRGFLASLIALAVAPNAERLSPHGYKRFGGFKFTREDRERFKQTLHYNRMQAKREFWRKRREPWLRARRERLAAQRAG